MSKVKFTSVSGFDGFEGMLNMELLWTNSSPTSVFAAQTISMNLSKYKMFVIVAKRGLNYGTYITGIVLMNESSLISMADAQNTFRSFTADSSGITFNDCFKQPTYGAANWGTDNSLIVPINIYGIN